MNKLINAICTVLCLIVANAYAVEVNVHPIKKILISKVVDHPALNATTQGIIESLADAGFKQGINLDLRVESAQANSAIAAQIANKFVAQNPDVVVGVGTLAAQSFIKPATLKKVNLIFSSVTDPIAAHLTGPRITGVSNFVNLEPQLQLMRSLQPNLQRLGIIYNPGEINAVSLVAKLEIVCTKLNIKLVKQAAAKTSDVAQSVAKLAGRVDAIFISNDNTALSGLQSIIRVAQLRMLPVYVSDTDAVAIGAVAALGPNQRELGRQTGRMIVQVLNGVAIEDLPIEFPQKLELVINLDAANKVGLSVPKSVLGNANKIIDSRAI